MPGRASTHESMPTSDEAMPALAAKYNVPLDKLDGWTVAVKISAAGCRILNPDLRMYAERLAARSVLARASRLVGPLRGATQTIREPMREPHGESWTSRTPSITSSASRTLSRATG